MKWVSVSWFRSWSFLGCSCKWICNFKILFASIWPGSCVCVLILKTGAAYCVCNSALSDSVLQKNIDYACGNGADCGPISPNGPCFNPNTVKDHCNYAVNSYYQKKGQTPINCDFASSATVVQTLPAGKLTSCKFIILITPSISRIKISLYSYVCVSWLLVGANSACFSRYDH